MTSNYLVLKPLKLAVLSFATLGIFNIYYYYQNFCRSKGVERFDLLVLIKSVLYPYFSYKMIVDAGRNKAVAKLVFVVQLIFTVGGVMFSNPQNLLGFFTFIPLLLVNNIFNQNEYEVMESIKYEKLIIGVGFIFVLTIIFQRLTA